MFGQFGAAINYTDGRYVYFLYPREPFHEGLFQYTLMPMHMRTYFEAMEFAGAQPVEPLGFTRGYPLWRLPVHSDARANMVSRYPLLDARTVLYDLEVDPDQRAPVEKPEMEARIRQAIIRLLREHEAPAEVFVRLRSRSRGARDMIGVSGASPRARPGACRSERHDRAGAATALRDHIGDSLERDAHAADASLSLRRLAPVRRSTPRGKPGNGPRPFAPGTKGTSMKRIARLAVALLVAFGAVAAGAQTYPARPIQLVVGFPPGGGVDIVARQLAERLTLQLGQPVVVDNKPGAAGNIAMELVSRAKPDGYTLLMGNLGMLCANPVLYPKLGFDASKDFAPVARVVVTPFIAAVPASLPVATLAEFVALAKGKPGQMNYGSGGTGNANHLAVELFQMQSGTKLQHIPYKGSAQSLTDLIGGRIQLVIDGANVVQPFVVAGSARALAITGESRLPSMPTLPTAKEAGIARLRGLRLAGRVRAGRHPDRDHRAAQRGDRQGARGPDAPEQALQPGHRAVVHFGDPVPRLHRRRAEALGRRDPDREDRPRVAGVAGPVLGSPQRPGPATIVPSCIDRRLGGASLLPSVRAHTCCSCRVSTCTQARRQTRPPQIFGSAWPPAVAGPSSPNNHPRPVPICRSARSPSGSSYRKT